MPRISGRSRTSASTTAVARTLTRATARTRTGARTRVRAEAKTRARAGARNRARAGARNRTTARAKVICSIGIPSNMGNRDRLKAKSPVAYLVGKSGSSVALPKKTFRGGLHEKASFRVGRWGLCR